MQRARYQLIVLLLLHSQLSGCVAGSPVAQASRAGMSIQTITTQWFHHRVFSDGGAEPSVVQNNAAKPVYVLIDGDGQAFLTPTLVAKDPTPEHSRLLELVKPLSAKGPVWYVGRPCYHQASPDPACEPRDWTTGRYSRKVVLSLVETIRQSLPSGQSFWLVGYSGGGVLAVLIADILQDQTLGVVTFGAPLDTAAWTALHQYSPLAASINPATNLSQMPVSCQVHLIGRRDSNVPPELVAGWRWRDRSAIRLINSNHKCCWQDSILATLDELGSRCE